MNELITYALAVLLFTFSGFSGQFNWGLGWIFIGLVCTFIVYNAIVVLRFSLLTLRVIAKTAYVKWYALRS